jgi:hypothetical protein
MFTLWRIVLHSSDETCAHLNFSTFTSRPTFLQPPIRDSVFFYSSYFTFKQIYVHAAQQKRTLLTFIVHEKII